MQQLWLQVESSQHIIYDSKHVATYHINTDNA